MSISTGSIDILKRLSASSCNLEDVWTRLNELIVFLAAQQSFIDAHLVNFFTEDLWDTRVPEEWRDDLERLTDYQLTHSSTERLEETVRSRSLTEFMKECRRLSLSGGKTEIGQLEMSDLCRNEERTGFAMRDKKRHEVNRMTGFLGFLTKAVDINQVIDIGSGRGYLSESLALNYRLKVIGLDSKEGNTKSAKKRNELIERISKSARKGHISSYLPVTEIVSVCSDGERSFLDQLVQENPGIVDVSESIGLIGLHTCGGLSHVIQRLFLSSHQFRFLCYVGCCYHLESDCDEGFPLSSFLKRKGATLSQTARNYCQKARDLEMRPDVVTSGILQTNPEVVPNKMTSKSNPEVTSKVNPEMMSEVDPEVTSYTASNHEVLPNKMSSPPEVLSSIIPEVTSIVKQDVTSDISSTVEVLPNKMFPVPEVTSTINPDVMLGILQTKPKVVSNKLSFTPEVTSETKPEVILGVKPEVPTSESLFYRAALQWIIDNHLGGHQDRFRVGKLYTKCDGFVDYVQKALKQIGVSCPDSLTATEIQSIHDELKLQWRLLNRFTFLHTLLAPCVESLILLDRLCHLMESETVTHAFIIPLFDNTISARNKAIVALKTLT